MPNTIEIIPKDNHQLIIRGIPTSDLRDIIERIEMIPVPLEIKTLGINGLIVNYEAAMRFHMTIFPGGNARFRDSINPAALVILIRSILKVRYKRRVIPAKEVIIIDGRSNPDPGA